MPEPPTTTPIDPRMLYEAVAASDRGGQFNKQVTSFVRSLQDHFSIELQTIRREDPSTRMSDRDAHWAFLQALNITSGHLIQELHEDEKGEESDSRTR
jgi:hypothetical protein